MMLKLSIAYVLHILALLGEAQVCALKETDETFMNIACKSI